MLTVLKTSGGLITRMLLVKIWSTHMWIMNNVYKHQQSFQFRRKWKDAHDYKT
ncbi:MAG: hypothetical protein WCK02_14660 [Bacteroidota bacterium]